MPKSHTISVRIYYEDTDCGNVVYHANYLKYMERGRTEFFRAEGIEFDRYHDNGIAFAVVEADIKFKRPAHYNDLLTVVTSVKEVTAATVTLAADIYRGVTLLAVGEAKIAAVKASGLPARLPPEIAAALS